MCQIVLDIFLLSFFFVICVYENFEVMVKVRDVIKILRQVFSFVLVNQFFCGMVF